MADLRNTSGLPLSSPEWLEVHHQAKLPERRRFAPSLAQLQPKRVVDLGCGNGLWLELLDEVMPSDCELIGLDCDQDSLDLARVRSTSWNHRTSFELGDIESGAIPRGDLTTIFNVFPYLSRPEALLELLASLRSTVAIRQYDGETIRVGPMEIQARSLIDSSLRASTASSRDFNHYDMDRVFEAVSVAPFANKDVGFELIQRVSPFPESFIPYFLGTLAWMSDHLSDDGRSKLEGAMSDKRIADPCRAYFVEVDLVARLS